MNLRQRLTRLEGSRVRTSTLTYVILDDPSVIRDNGSAALHSWIGRPYGELLAVLPKGTPLKVYLFDPRDGSGDMDDVPTPCGAAEGASGGGGA